MRGAPILRSQAQCTIHLLAGSAQGGASVALATTHDSSGREARRSLARDRPRCRFSSSSGIFCTSTRHASRSRIGSPQRSDGGSASKRDGRPTGGVLPFHVDAGIGRATDRRDLATGELKPRQAATPATLPESPRQRPHPTARWTFNRLARAASLPALSVAGIPSPLPK